MPPSKACAGFTVRCRKNWTAESAFLQPTPRFWPENEGLSGWNAKKVEKFLEIDLTKSKSVLNFIPMPPRTGKVLAEAVLKKFEKKLKNDLTNEKSMLNYNSIAPDEGDADCKEASDL